jgi:predicted TIM-barrel fold metal-dependent hydrolase
VAAAIGVWLIHRTEGVESPLFRRTWQARCLRSGASLFLEWGLLATVAGAYYQFCAANSQLAGMWLLAGLLLCVAGWPAYRLHGMYVNRHWLEKQYRGPAERLQRGVRNVTTVLVALFALGLLLPPVAWLVASSVDSLFADGGSEAITGVADFARGLHHDMTSADLFGVPLLVALAIAMAVVILFEGAAYWFAERWSKRQPRQMASPAEQQHARLGLDALYWALGYQHDEINQLAMAERRRWLGGLLGVLMLLLPVVSLVLLAMAFAGGLAALLSPLDPVLKAVEPLKALGLSALFGVGYWLLTQVVAARQRHDPQSGFGDLFYRMATGISSIVEATEGWTSGPTMGRPRYFVFGHDHWADSKLLPRSRGFRRSEEKQWYVNAGTWLRGYVEESRQQEVNENHSTFVQIIPGLGEDEAPRVLRWNDGANQPEQIVRRKEPQSTIDMFWSRWEGGWVWVLVWASLLAVTLRLTPSGWMAGLWPLVWTLGLWLASWFLVNAAGFLLSLVSQPQPAPDPKDVTDMHCHVGVVGDQHPDWGRMSPEYRQMPVFKAMLLYGGLDEHQVCDASLRAFTKQTIEESHVGHIVCLALDPVYDREGNQHKELSYVWVANEYILDLQRELPDKVLFGASVHPYDLDFEDRVRSYVEKGAVLLKWLPSAQQIDLSDVKVREALEILATARNGKPLPLLLHVGPEYAIPSTDPSTASYDYLTWTRWDELRSRLRGADEPLRPVKSREIRANLEAGLRAGAVIIFAHCGLPYFAPRWFERFFEHSELRTIRRYLKHYRARGGEGKGRCYADVSALMTPFRRSYFSAIRRLPRESLLFGSDFPTPVFELSAGIGENLQDLRAIVEGELERVLVPEDNLIDVNYREVQHVFPGHPMFRNFDKLRS